MYLGSLFLSAHSLLPSVQRAKGCHGRAGCSVVQLKQLFPLAKQLFPHGPWENEDFVSCGGLVSCADAHRADAPFLGWAGDPISSPILKGAGIYLCNVRSPTTDIAAPLSSHSSATLAQITEMKESCHDEHTPQNVIILFINHRSPFGD